MTKWRLQIIFFISFFRYFVNGRDGISRIVTYIADENGYRPKVRFVNLGLESEETPKAETEKTFGLKSFEFVWYPI